MDLVYRWTGVGRTLDPRYPTNLATMILMVIAFVGASALALGYGEPIGSALLTGGQAALLLFFSWALARELAPDDPWAAFAGLVPLVIVWALGTRPGFLPGLVLVSATRVVNRTSGVVPKLTDLAGITILAAIACVFGEPWLAVTVAVSFVACIALDRKDLRPIAFAVASAGMVVLEWRRLPPSFDLPSSTWDLAAGAIALAFLGTALVSARPTSRTDVGGGELELARVRAGMFLVLVPASVALFAHDRSVAEAAGIFGPMLGVVIGASRTSIRKRLASPPSHATTGE